MLFHFFSHLDMRIPCGILCAGFWDLQQIKAKTIIGQSFEMKNQIDQRIKVETKYESQNGTAIIQIFTKKPRKDQCVVLLVTYVFVQGIYFRSKLEIFKFAKTSLLPLEMNPIVDPRKCSVCTGPRNWTIVCMASWTDIFSFFFSELILD